MHRFTLQGGTVDRTCSAGAQAWYNEVSLYRFTSRPYSDNNWQFR